MLKKDRSRLIDSSSGGGDLLLGDLRLLHARLLASLAAARRIARLGPLGLGLGGGAAAGTGEDAPAGWPPMREEILAAAASMSATGSGSGSEDAAGAATARKN
ncbi:MAG: hypothetical protein INR70_26775 [Parafilimonas terrae]|nr:hypothetical protein [Parafilimonas terrae]